MQAFGPSFVSARDLVAASASIIVTDATQVTEIQQARDARISLRKVRVASENIRKELKGESLKRGREIDNVAKMIAGVCEPEEARLQAAEDFAVRAEAARKAALVQSRTVLLAPYGVDTAFIDLGGMPDTSFQSLLSQSRTAHEARLAEASRLEAERVAAAKAKADEDVRIRAENERLRIESAERDRVAAAEREESLVKLREAHAARERVEAEAKEAAAKVEAENRAAEAARAKVAAEAEAKAKELADAVLRAERAKSDAKAKVAADVARKERDAIEAKHAEERQAAEEKAKAERAARSRLESAAPELLAAAKAILRRVQLTDHAWPETSALAAAIAAAEGGAK